MIISKAKLEEEAKERGDVVRRAVRRDLGGNVEIDADCMEWRFPEMVLHEPPSPSAPGVPVAPCSNCGGGDAVRSVKGARTAAEADQGILGA